MALAEHPQQHSDPNVPGEPAAEGLPSRDGGRWRWLGDVAYQMPSWLVSTIVHMGLLIALALVTLPPAVADKMVNHLVVSSDDQRLGDGLEQLGDEPLESIDMKAMTEEVPDIEALRAGSKDLEPVDSAVRAASPADPNEFGFDTAPKTDPLGTVGRFGTGSRDDPMAVVGGFGGDALSGRSDAGRREGVRRRGGTPQSEKAVDAALAWLAEHQFADGGWSFAHHLAPQCAGRCGNPGMSYATARNAATGMALLPFLGAGHTHEKGKYKNTVRAGLYFLTSRQDPQSGSLWETGGRMYSHGLASIALCEAYAMTRDRSLQMPAQGAINFICYAQDTVGGGWRYAPHEQGDTSVVGWQLMALKSGHLAYLTVPPLVVKRASKFLDSVQSTSGANYGYLGPGEGPSTEATTAIGLLCRMYLGWKRTEPHLQHGVQWISRRGPNTNLYYDYYATQVMVHWEGDEWKRWNAVMRDSLVTSQARAGHETGSWFIPDGDGFSRHNTVAGRLYCTALATMILEVYYRHMPIYSKQSAESGF